MFLSNLTNLDSERSQKKLNKREVSFQRNHFLSLALNIVEVVVENQTKKLLLQKMGRTDFPTRSRFSIPKGGLTTAPPFCFAFNFAISNSKKLN